MLQQLVWLEVRNPVQVEADLLPFLFGKEGHPRFQNHYECKSNNFN